MMEYLHWSQGFGWQGSWNEVEWEEKSTVLKKMTIEAILKKANFFTNTNTFHDWRAFFYILKI